MNRSRFPIVVVLIVSLLSAHFTRRWATAARAAGTVAGGSSAAGLSRMNSFALALMLGGLRGPLVMFLWPSAERQKNEKNLEDFDTKIEWIRLLQAEFDSVHIFQMWNKAYNISVQMANLGNKYVTILDALDYGRNVDAERPNNINIMEAIAQLYADKLGQSSERQYYRQRVRDETRARQPMVRVTMPIARRAEFEKLATEAGVPTVRLRFLVDDSNNTVSVTLPKAAADQIQPKLTGDDVKFAERIEPPARAEGPTLRRRQLDPMLDAEGKLLRQYVAARIPRPANLPADSEWNDGSELQYLKQFEPFPYGISTMALGYNYYKRGQVLQNVNKQKHAQLTSTVVDRNPPLYLKMWAEEEWERARRAEIEGVGLSVPLQRLDMEVTTAETMPDATVVHRSLIEEAIYEYDRAAAIIDVSVAEYRRHLVNDKTMFTVYLAHVDEIQAMQQLVRADRDYLKLLLAPTAEQTALRASAAEFYRDGVRRYRLLALRYFVAEEIAVRVYPPNVTKANIAEANLDLSELEKLVNASTALVMQDPSGIGQDEMFEVGRYSTRIQARLSNLGG